MTGVRLSAVATRWFSTEPRCRTAAGLTWGGVARLSSRTPQEASAASGQGERDARRTAAEAFAEEGEADHRGRQRVRQGDHRERGAQTAR
ncbi:hypothetical protein GCM10023238_03740 [Streptomyces heliomycini]